MIAIFHGVPFHQYTVGLANEGFLARKISKSSLAAFNLEKLDNSGPSHMALYIFINVANLLPCTLTGQIQKDQHSAISVSYTIMKVIGINGHKSWPK